MTPPETLTGWLLFLAMSVLFGIGFAWGNRIGQKLP